MDMAVKYRLPCCLANVNPDIESIYGIVLLPDGILRPSKEIVAGLHLGGPKIK